MAAGDPAVIFLETTLDTRFAVSFPARGTVADLKRRLPAEHSVCHPETGPVAVSSLEIERDGSWYSLSDFMDVQHAFRGVEGSWHLRVKAHLLPPHPTTRRDAGRGAGDAEQSASHPIAEKSTQNMVPLGVPQGGGNLALCGSDSPSTNQKHKPQEFPKYAGGSSRCEDANNSTMHQQIAGLDLAAGGSDASPTNHQNGPQECPQRASGQCEDADTMHQQISGPDVAACDSHNPPMSQLDNPQDCLEHVSSQKHKAQEFPKHAGGSGPCEANNSTMHQQSAGLDLAADGSDAPLTNHQNGPQESPQHASGRCEDADTMHQQISGRDVAACDNHIPPMNQLDEPQDCLEHVSSQRKDKNIMPLPSSEPAVAAYKDSGSDIAPCFESMKEDSRRLPSSVHYLDKGTFEGVPSAVTARKIFSSTLTVEKNITEQTNLGYDLGDHSHDLRGKPLPGQMEPRTNSLCNGESSMEGENTSDKEMRAHRGKEELRIAGLCSGENKCNETEIDHCAESTKEDSRQPTSSDHYLDKGEYEGTTPTIITEQEACYPRMQRFVAVRKVPLSMAKKTYAFSSTVTHQECSLKHNKKGVKNVKHKDSKMAARSSSRINSKEVSIGQNTVKRKIDHNLEVPGADTGSPDQFVQEHMVKQATRMKKKKKTKTKKLINL